MSRQAAEDAFSTALAAYQRVRDGSAEEAQVVLAMALSAHALTLYDKADAFRPDWSLLN